MACTSCDETTEIGSHLHIKTCEEFSEVTDSCLPTPEPGSYYTAWLVTEDCVPIISEDGKVLTVDIKV